MKPYISKLVKPVALLYMGLPLLYIPGSAVLFDVPAVACGSVLLSLKFYLLSLLSAIVGYGLWEMKRWAWYWFVAVNVFIVYQNALMAFHFGESHHPVLAFLISLAAVIAMAYWVSREIRVPYFFPRIHWWESDPRYRLSVPVAVTRGPEGGSLAGDILDLSLGGCFIKLRAELAQDEAVRLAFTVFGIPIECEGIIVWRTRSTVTTPKGVGIKFSQLSRAQKRTLRMIHQRMRKISTLYRRSRYLLNQEEYLRRLEELEAGLSDKPKGGSARVG